MNRSTAGPDHRRPLADAVSGDGGRTHPHLGQGAGEQPSDLDDSDAVRADAARGGVFAHGDAEPPCHVLDPRDEVGFEPGEDEGDASRRLRAEQRSRGEPDVAAAAPGLAVGQDAAGERELLGRRLDDRDPAGAGPAASGRSVVRRSVMRCSVVRPEGEQVRVGSGEHRRERGRVGCREFEYSFC
jgi:hypothetical protein